MTWETRQALIAESNRLLAMRAARPGSRSRPERHHAQDSAEDTSFAPDGDEFAPDTGADSEAGLSSTLSGGVDDLPSTAAATSGSEVPN
ncbi:MAG TPA: hypothetical protein VFF72_07945 [Caldimonas sp.]|nr:hypothetical protein [Caldimonas sp.]